jgi:hypothetical protein
MRALERRTLFFEDLDFREIIQDRRLSFVFMSVALVYGLLSLDC